ncbi:MAG: NINE protein, partial [Phycisphaerales bacterium]
MSNFPNSPGTIPTPPPQPGPPAPPFSGSSNRVACGVCGILLGGLGIHKFIYGATIPGVIMLVVTRVGGVFTGGIA